MAIGTWTWSTLCLQIRYNTLCYCGINWYNGNQTCWNHTIFIVAFDFVRYNHFFRSDISVKYTALRREPLLYCIVLYGMVWYGMVLYCMVLFCVVSRRIASHRIASYIVFHCPALPCFALHGLTLSCITLHYQGWDSRSAPSQWETALLCNDVSHWLDANLESVLLYHSEWPTRSRGITRHNESYNGIFMLVTETSFAVGLLGNGSFRVGHAPLVN